MSELNDEQRAWLESESLEALEETLDQHLVDLEHAADDDERERWQFAIETIRSEIERRSPPMPEVPLPPEPSDEGNAAAVLAEAERAVDEVDPMAQNRHYRLLGFHGDSIVFHLRSGRITYRRPGALTMPSTLIELAPQTWWIQLAGGDVLGSTQARSMGDALIRLADRLGPVDLTRIVGSGAARDDDDRVVYHLGDRLLVDGDERPLEHGGMIWLSEPRIALSASAGGNQIRAIAESVMRYRWATPDDGRRMLGWIVAALVGGALDWRPHLMMIAPPAEGKSWMLKEVVGPMFGRAYHRLADASSAAVARITSTSSLPVIIDEAEPTKAWVQDVLDLMRISAGGEGMRVRADNTGTGVVIQTPRFCGMLSATKMPLLSGADATRLSQVRFGPPVDDWEDVRDSILAAMQDAPEVRARVVRSASGIAEVARSVSKRLQAQGHDSREAMLSGALTAGWLFWGHDDEIVPAGTAATEHSDAEAGLMELLALTLRVSGSNDRSLLSWLREDSVAARATTADLLGCKRLGNAMLVAYGHQGLKRELRRQRSPLAGVDLGRLLLQIPGAERTNPRHIGTHRLRCVLLSATVLDTLGVSWELAPDETPPVDDGDPGPVDPGPSQQAFPDGYDQDTRF